MYHFDFLTGTSHGKFFIDIRAHGTVVSALSTAGYILKCVVTCTLVKSNSKLFLHFFCFLGQKKTSLFVTSHSPLNIRIGILLHFCTFLIYVLER